MRDLDKMSQAMNGVDYFIVLQLARGAIDIFSDFYNQESTKRQFQRLQPQLNRKIVFCSSMARYGDQDPLLKLCDLHQLIHTVLQRLQPKKH